MRPTRGNCIASKYRVTIDSDQSSRKLDFSLQAIEVVLVTGYTDAICTEAVRDYPVSKGVPKDKIEAIGVGEKEPAPVSFAIRGT